MNDVRPKSGLNAGRLKQLRELRQLSQREFARQCGFSETLIRKYESGESDPAGYFLKVISEQLEVSADYLLGRTDSPNGYAGDGTLSDEERTIIETFRRAQWPGVIKLGAEQLAK